jgi:hypothetical protein
MSQRILFALLLLVATDAMAERVIEEVNSTTFDQISARQMDNSKIYFTYTEKPGTFANWSQNSPVETEFLTIFPNYTEPKFIKRKGARPETENLHVYIAKGKAVLNRKIDENDLRQMITLERIASMDRDIKHMEIDSSRFLSNIAGQSGLKNFRWPECDPTGESIFRYQRELDLKVLNPPNREWCSDSERSTCVESCFLFSDVLWNMGVKINNTFAEDQKDYGVASQSEVRYFVNEAEMEKLYSVANLTGLNAPVTGVLEQNIFYVNQVIQTGKVLAVFQQHPDDPGKTIMTSFIMIGLRSHSWEKYPQLRDVLMGREFVLNHGRSIMLGLPKYSQNMAKAIIQKLEP